MSFETKKKPPSLSQKILLITALLVNLTPVSQGQKFVVSEIPSQQFTIDRINQEVYLKDFLSDTVRKIDLKNMEATITDFRYIPPVLSNKQHLLIYGNKLYDIDKHTYRVIANSSEDSLGYLIDSNFPGSFSPNDKTFMSGNPKNYILLDDSLLKPTPTGLNVYSIVSYNVRDAYPHWSSDTSFVFISSDNTILEYYLDSKKIDTLVIVNNYKRITGFSYNTKHNILAYSYNELPPKLYFHYKNTKKDSLIFSPFRDDSAAACWNSYLVFTSFSWSPDLS
ncbi:MAG: hypothetical protein Q8S01_03155, partial [Ignavibacteria bacterium]|nr:hypothetical protein [Ignavibacteria bacterium]